ncbi:MAG: translation elongation factor Ts [Chromatiales bacterium]|jgi:elongation factor Ts|nr:translation elongation factor Ts [Chromatiales bacterium]
MSKEISAALVKELRERTGSGLMECKRALVDTSGDVEAAIELMRKQGLVKADKKAGRIAAEGRIVLKMSADGKVGAMAEINCETDFVAKADDFIGFADRVLARALEARISDVEQLLAAPSEAGGAVTIDTVRRELVAKIGENVAIRRIALFQGDVVAGYLHGTRIGVLVDMKGGDATLARDIAMHVAASKPVAIDENQVPAELIAHEREIFVAQASESGKPPEIVEKMVAGRIKKFLAETTLVGQPFVKDPDTTVGKLLTGAKASVTRFTRFEVGEGIEKVTADFAAEVMAQVRGG